jgi:guanylate kinase
VFVVSGPSGAGKGTLIQAVLPRCPFLTVAVSATTRAMRPGEREGHDYYFLTAAEFERRARAGDFLEHVEYAGNRYGTLREEVERIQAGGSSPVIEIELRGARAIRHMLPGCVSVFIAPPSMAELARRLHQRGTEGDEQIARRLEVGREELQAMGEFDHRIVNADVHMAAGELLEVVCDAVGVSAP